MIILATSIIYAYSHPLDIPWSDLILLILIPLMVETPLSSAFKVPGMLSRSLFVCLSPPTHTPAIAPTEARIVPNSPDWPNDPASHSPVVC